MKKIIGVLMIAMAFGVAMPAQAQFKFGFKGGLNLAKADFDVTGYTSDSFTGFFIGPMAEFNIPLIGLGVDGALLFSQRGTKVSGEGFSETIKENGLEVPVNLKYSIGLGGLASIYFAAGPALYFNFSDGSVDKIADIKRKNAQLAINLGGGVKLFNHLQIGINYNMPMTDSAELKIGDIVSAGSYKTKVWQISLAYLF